jgi:hypothetical protein
VVRDASVTGALGRDRSEEDLVGIELEILGEAVEGEFEVGLEIVAASSQSEQGAHEDFTGTGTGITLRTEAHFPRKGDTAQLTVS